MQALRSRNLPCTSTRGIVRAVEVEVEESFTSKDEGSPVMTTSDLKAALLDSFYGSDRGLSAQSEIRAE